MDTNTNTMNRIHDCNEEYMLPIPNEFTVYSKTGCSHCTNVKRLLVQKNVTFSVIDCDEYLIHNKPKFLEFIQTQTGREWKTFPIVFSDKQEFIGGFTDTEQWFDKKLEFNEDF